MEFAAIKTNNKFGSCFWESIVDLFKFAQAQVSRDSKSYR